MTLWYSEIVYNSTMNMMSNFWQSHFRLISTLLYWGVYLHLWEGGYNFSGGGHKNGPHDIRKKAFEERLKITARLARPRRPFLMLLWCEEYLVVFKLHAVFPFLTHTFSRQHLPVILFSSLISLCHETANCEAWNLSYNFLLANLAYKFWNGNYMYENYSITTKINWIDVHIARNVYSCWNVWEFVLF